MINSFFDSTYFVLAGTDNKVKLEEFIPEQNETKFIFLKNFPQNSVVLKADKEVCGKRSNISRLLNTQYTQLSQCADYLCFALRDNVLDIIAIELKSGTKEGLSSKLFSSLILSNHIASEILLNHNEIFKGATNDNLKASYLSELLSKYQVNFYSVCISNKFVRDSKQAIPIVKGFLSYHSLNYSLKGGNGVSSPLEISFDHIIKHFKPTKLLSPIG